MTWKITGLPPGVDNEEMLEAVKQSMFGPWGDPGYCMACGEHHEGVEPDAENYPCETCGENAVFGAEEWLTHGHVEEVES